MPEALRLQAIDHVLNDLRMTRFGQNLFSRLVAPRNVNDDPRRADPAGFDFSAVSPHLPEFLVPL
jgi:hypothetical protein